MAYTDWSTDPNANTTIDGTNIAENCPPQNLNDASRSIMAGVASLAENIPATDGLMPKDSGTFEGDQPRMDGGGALLSHASSANASGRIYLLADGSANPATASQGDIVLFYTP